MNDPEHLLNPFHDQGHTEVQRYIHEAVRGNNARALVSFLDELEKWWLKEFRGNAHRASDQAINLRRWQLFKVMDYIVHRLLYSLDEWKIVIRHAFTVNNQDWLKKLFLDVTCVDGSSWKCRRRERRGRVHDLAWRAYSTDDWTEFREVIKLSGNRVLLEEIVFEACELSVDPTRLRSIFTELQWDAEGTFSKLYQTRLAGKLYAYLLFLSMRGRADKDLFRNIFRGTTPANIMDEHKESWNSIVSYVDSQLSRSCSCLAFGSDPGLRSDITEEVRNGVIDFSEIGHKELYCSDESRRVRFRKTNVDSGQRKSHQTCQRHGRRCFCDDDIDLRHVAEDVKHGLIAAEARFALCANDDKARTLYSAENLDLEPVALGAEYVPRFLEALNELPPFRRP